MTATRLLHADCLDALPTIDAGTIGAVVTDPPYELGFMGKSWDRSGIANDVALWQAVYRAMKPGAYLVAFGGSRTYHRMACAIEDAGFVVKDSLMWLYGSGFPKSLNLGDGIGTALKPAHEPIVLAQKPLQGTYAANVARWGVGGLNIDGCRIAAPDGVPIFLGKGQASAGVYADGLHGSERTGEVDTLRGRWPANVMLDEDAAAILDLQSGERKAGGRVNGAEPSHTGQNGIYGTWGRVANEPHNDTGGASRFFYCAKASRSERDAGLGAFPLLTGAALTDRQDGSAGLDSPRSGAGRISGGRNIHPTVKPIALMRWLVRLVTPPGQTVLDPFMGSGTTGVACVGEGRAFIGIEREAQYHAIAAQRIAAAQPVLNLDGAA